jgi:hypothetical protein
MRLIGLAVILAVGLFAAPLAARAQPTQRVYRIGFLGQTSPSDYSSQIAALRQGLRDAPGCTGDPPALGPDVLANGAPPRRSPDIGTPRYR